MNNSCEEADYLASKRRNDLSNEQAHALTEKLTEWNMRTDSENPNLVRVDRIGIIRQSKGFGRIMQTIIEKLDEQDKITE